MTNDVGSALDIGQFADQSQISDRVRRANQFPEVVPAR